MVSGGAVRAWVRRAKTGKALLCAQSGCLISDSRNAACHADPDEKHRQQRQQEDQPPMLMMYGGQRPRCVVGMDGESEIQVVWACSHG